jgi:hypothetical protein
MNFIKNGFLLLMLATFVVACSDDDSSAPAPTDSTEDPVADNDNAKLVGTWYIASEAEAIKVSTLDGATVHWSMSADDVAKRGCLLDDQYIFGADDSFTNVVGDYTWIEPWQGVGSEGCGTPVAPSNGSSPGTFEFDGDQITITGAGSYLGLAKVFNGATHESPEAVSDVTSVVYDVYDFDETAGILIITIGYDDAGNIFTIKFVKDAGAAYTGGTTTCPADNGLPMGAFGGASVDCGVFTFPTGAEPWGGWANSDATIYPLDCSAGVTVTFSATTETATSVRFRFEKAAHPDIEPGFEATQAITVGTADYTVTIPAADVPANPNNYSSFLMYIVDRDVPVAIADVIVTTVN